ncbi:hypothetical protein HMI55_004212 [Coelomomyces lativittatus]|nr:hypothetical protein HMI55_004212 [Coelomomyces lativittatus]KAJ1508318.1 hypothetical protein HMI56_007348 [Coelomomyces lativittatus]
MEDLDTSKVRFLKNFQTLLSKETLKSIFLDVHEKLVELVFSFGWTVHELEQFLHSLLQEIQDPEIMDHLARIVVQMFKAFCTMKNKKVGSSSNELTDTAMNVKLT